MTEAGQGARRSVPRDADTLGRRQGQRILLTLLRQAESKVPLCHRSSARGRATTGKPSELKCSFRTAFLSPAVLHEQVDEPRSEFFVGNFLGS